MSKKNSSNSGPEIFGNLDEDKEYPITQHEKDNFVLVRYYGMTGSKKNIVDHETFRYQFFEPGYHEELEREDEETFKKNDHYINGEKYKVLNVPEPAKEEADVVDYKEFSTETVKFKPETVEGVTTYTSADGSISFEVLPDMDYKAHAKDLVKQSK